MRKTVCVLLFFLILLSSVNVQAIEMLSEEQYEKYWISQASGAAGHPYDYDLTDQYIFFAYGSQTSVVDAYDRNGNFCFSIHVPDYQNGGVYIRCEDETLYLRSKTDTVYVFSGETLLYQMSKGQAESQGYAFDWFYPKGERMKLKWFAFYELDDAGNYTKKLSTPHSVIDEIIARAVIVTLLPIIIIVCSVVVLWRQYKEGKRKKRLDQ